MEKTLTIVLVCGALFVAAGSPRPLIRVAATLAALGLVTAWLLVRQLSRDRLRTVTAWCGLTLIVSGIGVFLAAWWLGGSALSGAVVQGDYYVMEHGQSTEVPVFAYFLLAALELLVSLLLPAAILMVASAEKPPAE